MSASSTPPQHETDVAWSELGPVLHDEIDRLPEKYRLPIILSYLEGKSNEEVARLLDWPTGTVKGRLSRARDLLRSRLMRRGLVLSAAFLSMALSQNVVCAEVVPESLIDRTLKRALDARAQQPAGPSARPQAQERAGSLLRGRNLRPAAWPALLALIAALSLGLALTSLLRNDPGAVDRVLKSLSAVALGRASTGCH